MKRPLAAGVELVQDISALSSPVRGYLVRLRHRLKTVLDDGSRTETYIADVVDRAPDKRDAVTIAIYAPAETVMETKVLLRRQLRYGAYLATGAPLVTELPAGVIEGEDPRETTVRELWEEASIEVTPDDVMSLGPPFYALPSILTERIHPTAVAVTEAVLDASIRSTPEGDGSPFEEGAELFVCTLGEALDRTQRDDDGSHDVIADAKTELVLARLAAALDNQSR